MKKIIQILFWILLLSSPLFAASYYGGGGVSTDSNCDQAKYYSIGRLCQDTDDGKLYKGTGAAVVEIAAGNSGDFLANGTVPMTGILDAALGLYTKNGETSAGFIDFFEDGSNGSNYARLYGPASLTGNISWILPNTALARGSFLIGSSTANTFGWLTVGETGKVITTDGTDPAWSAYTVAAPGAAGAVLYSDGTNWTRSATPSLQALTLTGANTLALGTSRTNDGKVIFSSGTALNDYLFTIQASNFGANLTWTLPTAAPGGANYLLNVDADGTMGYTDPSTLGNVAADTIWDAAGDLAVGTGANTAAKLVIGTPYQLLHVASGTLAYTSTLGAALTPLTAGYFTDLTVTNAIAGSVTGNAGTATALAANPTDCSEGELATAIDASGNLTCGKAIGTDVQAYNSDLTTLAGGGTANCIWGEKSDSSGIECKTSINIQMDDSAAQFKSATASKGTLKFDQTGITDTKLVTVKYTATDSYTYTPTLVGNVSHLLGTTWTNGKWCSYSTSTGLTCNEDAPAGSGDVTGAGDCASGACYDGSSDGGTYIRLYDGTSAYEALTGGVRKFTFSSSTANSEDLSITLGDNDNTVTLSSSTGVTKASLSALNLVTTGTISGKIPMISKSGNYTLGTDNAQEAYGYMVWLTGDGTILTLPAVAAGMSVCVYSADSYDKVVNPNDNDGIRNGTTTRNADGHAITSGATDQGSFVCLIGDSADGWTVLGKAGTWTDE